MCVYVWGGGGAEMSTTRHKVTKPPVKKAEITSSLLPH